MAEVKSECKVSKLGGNPFKGISFLERVMVKSIGRYGIEVKDLINEYDLDYEDEDKTVLEIIQKLTISHSFKTRESLKDKIAYINYYLKDKRETILGLTVLRNKLLKEISSRIEEIGCVLHIDNCSEILLETMKKMVESSLTFGKRVIVNSFCYNLGTKSVRQQFNFRKESAIDLDLFLVDPNFERDEQRIQIYDYKKYRLVEDKDFRIEIKDVMSGEMLSVRLIKKYYNKELNWTVFTVPARVYENENLYRLKRNLYLTKNRNLKVITFSDFL